MGSRTTVKWKGWPVQSQREPCRPRPVWVSGCGTLAGSGGTARAGQLPQARPTGRQICGDCLLTQTWQSNGDAQNWRTIAVLSHVGKAWSKASVRPLASAVAKVAGPCHLGSLPGRSTRDAVAILENVFERFTSPGHQACRRRCLLAGFLFDLEKAIDTVPRDRLRAAVASAAKFKGLSVVLEARHAGTCHVIRKCFGRPISKVHVTLGVRQGSVQARCEPLFSMPSVSLTPSGKDPLTPEGHCSGLA